MNDILKRVSVDGLPKIGRPFIAYDTMRDNYEIFTREDKEWIRKQNWRDEENHISPDGEFYRGENSWIFSIKFDSYIYTDDLGKAGLKTLEGKEDKE